MSVLTRFLNEAAERLRSAQTDRIVKQQDWIRGVTDLVNRLADWVRDADTNHVVDVKVWDAFSDYKEESTGEYKLPSLEIKLDTRSVWVGGKARDVVDQIKPEGYVSARRVDGMAVISDFPPDIGGVTRAAYYLYRFVEVDGDYWFVRHPLEAEAKLLTRERFEAILVSLLK